LYSGTDGRTGPVRAMRMRMRMRAHTGPPTHKVIRDPVHMRDTVKFNLDVPIMPYGVVGTQHGDKDGTRTAVDTVAIAIKYVDQIIPDHALYTAALQSALPKIVSHLSRRRHVRRCGKQAPIEYYERQSAHAGERRSSHTRLWPCAITHYWPCATQPGRQGASRYDGVVKRIDRPLVRVSAPPQSAVSGERPP